MKVLVTGVNGQLGFDVVRELQERNIECLGVDKEDFDLTNEEKTNEFIVSCHPDAIIHCAAYTAVDKAEDNKELCGKINFLGTKYVANAAKKIDAKMIYISTDYVFGGDGNGYHEVDDSKNPQNVYGKTKLRGEEAVRQTLEKYFIVRTSWVFGLNGNNFVKTMRRVGETHSEVQVVSDQIGSPTYTFDLSKLLCDMVVTEKYGTYHATNEELCSWSEFCEEIFRLSGIKSKVDPISTEEYGAKAQRPKNSRLSKKCLDEAGFSRLPSWKDALERYIKLL